MSLIGLPRDMSDMGYSTERERLLAVVLDYTFGQPTLYSTPTGIVVPHIDGYSRPQIGDLVVGNTRSVIGYYQSVRIGNSTFENVHYIKLLGTDFVQSWTNESFKIIRGIPEYLLYTGDKRRFALLAYDAILRGDEYVYRFCDVKVNDDGTAVVSTRKRWSRVVLDTHISDWNKYLRYKTGATLHKFLKENGMMDDDKYMEVNSERED